MEDFKLPHIKIKLHGIFTDVFIDGQEVNGVKSFELKQKSGDTPQPEETPPELRLTLTSEMNRTLNTLWLLELPDIYKGFYAEGFKLIESGIATAQQLNALDIGKIWE